MTEDAVNALGIGSTFMHVILALPQLPAGSVWSDLRRGAYISCGEAQVTVLKSTRAYLLACSLIIVLQPLPAAAQESARNGQRDFDF